MTTPIDFYCHVAYNSFGAADQDNANITFKPCHPRYFASQELFFPGTQTNATFPDPGTGSFGSLQDAIDYFYNDPNIDIILTTISGDLFDTAVRGDIVFNIPETEEELNIRQPLATTLTELSEITISGDVMLMLGAADIAGAASAFAAPMSDALALDTMAFESVSNYYMKSTVDSTFAPISHTHTASQISDSSSVGRSVLTAANAAAARTAIGAGTSNVVSYYDLTTKPAAKSIDNAPTPTIQTVAAAANGTRLSTFRDATVNYSVDIATSVSLSGNATGYVVLEIAATNSTTAGDWKEIARTTSGQSGTLVIGLVLNQTGGGNLSGVVPAGWYRRLRSVNTAGTPTYTLRGCQESLDEPLQTAS